VFTRRFVENLNVFEIRMCAETGVGWECPWSGGPVRPRSAHASSTGLESNSPCQQTCVWVVEQRKGDDYRWVLHVLVVL
jgi:hypothetical protein